MLGKKKGGEKKSVFPTRPVFDAGAVRAPTQRCGAGNSCISQTTRATNRIACALNSQTTNFSRSDPQPLLVVSKGQLVRRGRGAARRDFSPPDWLPVTSFYDSASCSHFSFPLSGTSSPPTARPSREERGRAPEPGPAFPTLGLPRVEAAAKWRGLRLRCSRWFSELGKCDTARRLPRGHRLTAR